MAWEHDFSGIEKQEIIDTLAEVRHPVDIAIYGSKNEWNFGAIIRNCHNFLVNKIYGIDIGRYYKKAAMTALKWEKHLIEHHTIESFLEATHDRNIVGLERRSTLTTEDIRSFTYPENPILLFGSEKFGLEDSLIKRSNHLVSIPVYGFVSDFNLSIATGIVLYDWINKYYRGQCETTNSRTTAETTQTRI